MESNLLFHSAIFLLLDEQYVGCLAIVARALERGRRGKGEVRAGNERLRVCLCVVLLQHACRMKIQIPILNKYKYRAYTNTHTKQIIILKDTNTKSAWHNSRVLKINGEVEFNFNVNASLKSNRNLDFS